MTECTTKSCSLCCSEPHCVHGQQSRQRSAASADARTAPSLQKSRLASKISTSVVISVEEEEEEPAAKRSSLESGTTGSNVDVAGGLSISDITRTCDTTNNKINEMGELDDGHRPANHQHNAGGVLDINNNIAAIKSLETKDNAPSPLTTEEYFINVKDIERKIYVHFVSSLPCSIQRVSRILSRFCTLTRITLIDSQSACVELDHNALFDTYDRIYEFAKNPINSVHIEPYVQYFSRKFSNPACNT